MEREKVEKSKYTGSIYEIFILGKYIFHLLFIIPYTQNGLLGGLALVLRTAKEQKTASYQTRSRGPVQHRRGADGWFPPTI